MLLLLSRCATALPACSPGLSGMDEARLFFGGSIPAQQWSGFVDQEIAPRFPDGFTIIDTQGAWRDRTGATVRETGHELVVVFTGAAREQAMFEAVRNSYKQRFMQESVLLTESPVCAAF